MTNEEFKILMENSIAYCKSCKNCIMCPLYKIFNGIPSMCLTLYEFYIYGGFQDVGKK